MRRRRSLPRYADRPAPWQQPLALKHGPRPGGMTKFECPMIKEAPMAKHELPIRRHRNQPTHFVIRSWSFFGHWAFGIGHFDRRSLS